MGIKTTDLVPINPIYPTALSPVAKEEYIKVFQVPRTATASTVVCVLPADVSILSFSGFYGTNSNAGTTATVTLNVTKDGNVIATGTYNAQTSATVTAVPATGLPNIEGQPLGGDLRITATYGETGTASTAGGPYNFIVRFVR